jgi:hypothetical protein
VIVNHSVAFIFVHVPKAAGTTLARLLSPLSTVVNVELGGSPWGEEVQRHYKARFGLGKHTTAHELRAALGEARWPTYFRFAIVRNPYTRALSSYQFLRHKRAVKGRADLEALDGLPSFSDYVRSDFFQGPGPDRMLHEQVFWTHGPRAEAATQACEVGPPLLDFIGSVEGLSGDVATIAGTLSRSGHPLALPAALPRFNSVPQAAPDLWDLLRREPATEAAVYQRYAADFAAYGYRRFDAASTEAYTPNRVSLGMEAAGDPPGPR